MSHLPNLPTQGNTNPNQTQVPEGSSRTSWRTFWQAVGAIGAIVGGIATAWLAWGSA